MLFCVVFNISKDWITDKIMLSIQLGATFLCPNFSVFLVYAPGPLWRLSFWHLPLSKTTNNTKSTTVQDNLCQTATKNRQNKDLNDNW